MVASGTVANRQEESPRAQEKLPNEEPNGETICLTGPRNAGRQYSSRWRNTKQTYRSYLALRNEAEGEDALQ